MVGDITDIYVNSFQRMLRDGNFRPEELSAIAFGYTKLLDVYKRQGGNILPVDGDRLPFLQHLPEPLR